MQDNVSILKDIISNRRSTRWFLDKPIGRDILLEIVEAGVNAPSSANVQNQRFLIIDNKEAIKKFGRIRFSFPYSRKSINKFPSGLIGEATAVIVVFTDVSVHKYPLREKHIWSKMRSQNAAASIQNMLLMATANGLGSCWISAIPEMDGTRLLCGKTWKDTLIEYKVPLAWEVYGVVTLGYPRHLNKDGFPRGEVRHQGKPVARKDVSFYVAEVNR